MSKLIGEILLIVVFAVFINVVLTLLSFLFDISFTQAAVSFFIGVFAIFMTKVVMKVKVKR